MVGWQTRRGERERASIFFLIVIIFCTGIKRDRERVTMYLFLHLEKLFFFFLDACGEERA